MYPMLMLYFCHVSFIHGRVDVSGFHQSVVMFDYAGGLTFFRGLTKSISITIIYAYYMYET